MSKENLPGKLTKNKRAFAIILALAVSAVLGSITVASVIAQSNDNATSSAPSQSNAQPYFKEKPHIQGSVNISDNILSSAKVKFSDAANTAATNGTVIGGRLAVVQNYLVYEFTVLDSGNKVHKVIIDAGDGKVLYTSEGFDMNVQMLLGGHGPGHWSMGKSRMHQFPHIEPQK